MQIFRRPLSSYSRRTDDSPVNHVRPKELKDAVANGRRLSFGINKNAKERMTLGAIRFEEEDMYALLEGAVVRLRNDHTRFQSVLKEIEKTLDNNTMDEHKKLNEIRRTIVHNYVVSRIP